jgi:molybdopterin-containing oxidoreductase family iron-sulfur binding subunit
MHWMRIDRYYSGDTENPEVAYQPMLCQHCENAPCETVCPVIATSHDDEGINQQTYNRCVGTRYCANNCPYKVRRFNWFTYTDVASPQHMQYNPDVTVRTRGVMEKCNFCSQRIRDAKHRAKDMGRPVKDGEILTACQQSCPSNAIIFGNLNDKGSQVAKLTKDARGYHVLGEINVKPSITYLTKIRNTSSSRASEKKSGESHHS